MTKEQIKITYDPQGNKSTYQVGDKVFEAEFYAECGCRHYAFEPFCDFLKACNVEQGEIDRARALLENGEVTTCDITMDFLGVDGEFISEL